MKQERLEMLARALMEAQKSGQPIEPITKTDPDLLTEDAYRISQIVFNKKLAAGATPWGRKIGLTSLAVQAQIGVTEPDYGYLTQDMLVQNEVLSERLIQGRAEGEVAFLLARDLVPAPGSSMVFENDVIQATAEVRACIEIIDSRIKDWKIKIQDTVADNASSARIALSETGVALTSELDLSSLGMALYKNGEVVSTGSGAACLGTPLRAVAWLANKMSTLGSPLRAGEWILSGAYGPVVPMMPGDFFEVRISKLGSAKCKYL